MKTPFTELSFETACENYVEEAHAVLEGRAEQLPRSRMAHLQTCSRCRAHLERLALLRRVAFRGAIWNPMHRSRTPRSWPSFSTWLQDAVSQRTREEAVELLYRMGRAVLKTDPAIRRNTYPVNGEFDALATLLQGFLSLDVGPLPGDILLEDAENITINRRRQLLGKILALMDEMEPSRDGRTDLLRGQMAWYDADTEGARASFEIAASAARTAALAATSMGDLAIIEWDSHRHDQALRLNSLALEFAPQSPAYHLNGAMWAHLMGSHRAASLHIDAAVRSPDRTGFFRAHGILDIRSRLEATGQSHEFAPDSHRFLVELAHKLGHSHSQAVMGGP